MAEIWVAGSPGGRYREVRRPGGARRPGGRYRELGVAAAVSGRGWAGPGRWALLRGEDSKTAQSVAICRAHPGTRGVDPQGPREPKEIGVRQLPVMLSSRAPVPFFPLLATALPALSSSGVTDRAQPKPCPCHLRVGTGGAGALGQRPVRPRGWRSSVTRSDPGFTSSPWSGGWGTVDDRAGGVSAPLHVAGLCAPGRAVPSPCAPAAPGHLPEAALEAGGARGWF